MLGSLNDRSFINVLEMPIIKMTRVADHLQGRKSNIGLGDFIIIQLSFDW